MIHVSDSHIWSQILIKDRMQDYVARSDFVVCATPLQKGFSSGQRTFCRSISSLAIMT
jgi:hypothetical protein